MHIPLPAGYYDRVVECVPKRHSSETDTRLLPDSNGSSPDTRQQNTTFAAEYVNAPSSSAKQAPIAIPVPDVPVLQLSDASTSDKSSLERTKSVSSVSSAQSTSSIEAAPFRAPPRGNMRAPQRIRTNYSNPTNAAAQMENASGTSSHMFMEPVHNRVPKQLNDDWVFRNGPSMKGSGSRLMSPRLGLSTEGEKWQNDESIRAMASTPRPDKYDDDAGWSRNMLTQELTASPSNVNSNKYPSRPPSRTSSRASYKSRNSTITVHARPRSFAESADTTRRDSAMSNTLSPVAHASIRSDDMSYIEDLPSAEPTIDHNMLTPAQVVRMEARAGVARVPTSPSLPQPGISDAPPSPNADERWSSQMTCSSSRVSDVSSNTPTIVPTISAPSSQNSEENTPPPSISQFSDEVRRTSPLPPLPTERPLPAVPVPPSQRAKRSPNDFVFGEVLGEGSYSTVLKAWEVQDCPASDNGKKNSALQAVAGQTLDCSASNRKAYAVKMLDKVHILREKKQKYVGIEKEALSMLLHRPGIITLFWTFQDRDSLYFVLELAPNGELLHYIQQFGSLDLRSAAFYAAQLADAIDGIHAAGIIHRDIKPENILLGEDMRIRITDFGSARILSNNTVSSQGSGRVSSFVGTAEYVSPELLGEKLVGPPSDWWAFGCVVYQMLAGRAPFKAANEYQTFQRIIRRSFTYPPELPQLVRDFIDPLLALDPMERPTASRIKAHAFFGGISFATIWTCEPPRMEHGLVSPPELSKASLERGLQELEASFEKIPVSLAGDLQLYASDSQESSSSHRDTEISTSGSGESSDEDGTVKHGEYPGVLLPTEMILYSSPIKLKKTGARSMFSKRCKLLLTNFPRLLCMTDTRNPRIISDVRLIPLVDPNRESVRSPSQSSFSSGKEKQYFQPIQAFSRGIMRMNSQIAHAATSSSSNVSEEEQDETNRDPVTSWLVYAEARGRREFVVATPTRQFVYDDPSGDAAYWVQCILDTQCQYANAPPS
ncbi:non-specific serine/threonine protein kinase [Malassezia cuniculi]|uniref:non-specific serine/threonine protein kinase n=1 Tax=Malassezia cuniculi TaxID=948313 RepID=A0AAF0J8H0_9BASI|nr:non-specific serine/threonine protein kinase [Malassezia cuniculi]